MSMDDIDKKISENPLGTARRSGLMGRSIDILLALQSKKAVESEQSAGNQAVQKTSFKNVEKLEMGNVGKMSTVNLVERSVEADENRMSQADEAPIVFKNGIYSIQNNLETSAVKMDPMLKALVDSVCHK